MSKWLRENLFKGWIDGIITVVVVSLCLWLIAGFIEWAVIRSVWNASSLEECHQIVLALHGENQLGACWAVFNERTTQFLFGFYPREQYWRPILAFFLLFAAIAPIVFASLPRKLFWFTAVYPVIAFVLIWGAFGLEPVKSRNINGFLLTLVLGGSGGAAAIVFGVILGLGRQYGVLSTKVFVRR